MAEKTVVLVHGAFADGSSWDEVIPLLQDAFQAFGLPLARETEHRVLSRDLGRRLVL